jgi:uncharacterized protein
MKCPECGSTNVRKSHWKRDETEGSKLLFSPYRCRDCHHRFKRISNLFKIVSSMATIMLAFTVFVVLMFSASLGTSQPAHYSDELDRDAIKQFRTSAEKGDAEAQYRLALMLLNGDRMAQNYEEALKWFDASAKQNHLGAQYNLGQIYRFGRGTMQDYSAAAYWFEKAARLGDPGSQYQLGSLYKVGQGVQHDSKKAYVWYNLAAAKGYDPAIAARDAIATFMSTAEVAQAQALSKAWKIGQDIPQTADASVATTKAN